MDPPPAEPPARALPSGRPTVMDVWQRYQHILATDDRPYYLDIHEDIYADDRPQRGPEACLGPINPEKNCGRQNFCLWCYERRAHNDGLRAAMIHSGQPNLYRISIPLGQGRNHPMHAKDCMRRVAGVLRRHGFSRFTLWLHPFGPNPCDGIRAHIEGLVSGADADPDVLDPEYPRAIGSILERFREGGEDSGQPASVHTERLHPHSTKHVDDLVRHAIECARPSFPVRRIWAGMYLDKMKRVRCRMTDIVDGQRPYYTKDLACPSPDNTGHATRDELLTWAIMAESWRTTVEKPVMTRKVDVEQHFADLVIQATPWREAFRLGSDDELRNRWARAPEFRRQRRERRRHKARIQA